MNKKIKEFGGAGSGNFGHAGIPREVGGSAPGGGGGSSYKNITDVKQGDRVRTKYGKGTVTGKLESTGQVVVLHDKVVMVPKSDKTNYNPPIFEGEKRLPNDTTIHHYSKILKFSQKEMSEEIEIDSFKAGKYPQGEFTEANINEVCETYNPSNYEAPVLIGHVSDYKGASKIPAFGWIGAARNVAGHLRLSISQFSDELKDLIKGGYYKKVSAAFYDPQDESNPTPGKWHLHHLAFLGGTPPQVKGLEGIAFAEINGVGTEFAEEEPQMDFIDKVEEQGKEGTKKDIAECLAGLQSSLEEMIDNEEDHDRMVQEVYEHVNDIMSTLNIHDAFQKRLEDLEENKEGEYSEQKSFWHEFKEFITNKFSSTNQKESNKNMDAQKEKEYQDKIAVLEAEKKEFAEKQKTDELKLADEKLKVSVHSFCESNGLNTNKAKELKVEENLFIAAKANGMKEFSEADNKDSFNSLKGIFSALNLSPETGEMREFSQPLPGDEKNKDAKIVAAEQYIKDHPNEFSESPEVNLRKALLKFI